MRSASIALAIQVRALGCPAEAGLQLGESVLDQIELGAVGREVEQNCSSRLDCSPDTRALMAAEIVHDGDVVGPQFRHQNLIEVGLEGNTVNQPIEHHRRYHAAVAQPDDEGGGLLMSMRDGGP